MLTVRRLVQCVALNLRLVLVAKKLATNSKTQVIPSHMGSRRSDRSGWSM